MILIITGPPASGKTNIAKKIQVSTQTGIIYDEMPSEKPASLPDSGFVIITTQLQIGQFPAWIRDTNCNVLQTITPGLRHIRRRERIDENQLTASLAALMSGIQHAGTFESHSKGTDNTAARIFQYLGEVPVGEYFLCDCIGNTVDLCLATKAKYRNKSGRAVHCKVIATLIPDARRQLGDCVNGCWQIPWHLFQI